MIRTKQMYLIVLAHCYTRGGVLAGALLSRHPLARVIGRRKSSRSIWVRVLPLLVGKLTIGTELLTSVVGL